MHRSPQHVTMVYVSALGGCACGKEAARCALAESTAVAALGLPGRCMVLAAEGGLPILSDAC